MRLWQRGPVACGRVLQRWADEVGVAISRVFTEGLTHPTLSPHPGTFTDDLARVLATGVNLFHPLVALAGGGVTGMPGFPKERFARTFFAHLRCLVPSETLSFVWATPGSRASLYGAAEVV